MICSVCARAADTNELNLHSSCTNHKIPHSCDCQHRDRKSKSGDIKKIEGSNGDGS